MVLFQMTISLLVDVLCQHPYHVYQDHCLLLEVYNPGQENIVEGASPSDDFFEGLEDYLAGFSSGQNTEFNTNGMRLLQVMLVTLMNFLRA
ncbi:hypothetical protein GLYMA_05G191333v4 [Glycine max]|nr:hypothetical protein GLYMA_05G191333v4 [Glycine max]KAH1135226.1 hypothetical protein GYH30_013146 [Glycine max]